VSKHLGDFGTPKPVADANTFGWFGTTMRVRPGVSLIMVDFIDMAAEIDEDDPKVKQFVVDMLKKIVVDDDWVQFWGLAKDNGQEIPDLLRLMNALTEAGVEADTSRPTQRRSGSSPGRRGTGRKSKANSSEQVSRQLVKRGRADLAEVIQMSAREEQATG